MAETLPLAATDGELRVPQNALGVVMLAQGQTDRDETIRHALHEARFATLRIEPATAADGSATAVTVRAFTEELLNTASWIQGHPVLANLSIGMFASQATGGAVLAAAAARPERFRALVLCDGRPEVAGSVLDEVRAATLLIVDSQDEAAVSLSQETMTRVRGIAELELLSGFPMVCDDPETLAQIARLARRWFDRFLA